MARQVLPFVGAAVGFVVGGPTGAQVGFTLGSIVGSAVDPQVIKGPKLGEAGLQTSAEGVYRPIVFGCGAVKGNIIVRGNRQVKTQRTRQGKGGGPVTEEQRVYWTFAIRVCEGPITGITRIWQDEKLVYDIRPETQIAAESADFATRFRLYIGDEAQMPDPDLEAFQGMGNSSAYRGTCYIVFPNYDLTDRRESIPDFRFEVVGTGDPIPPIDVGAWIFGPVALNGASGGPQTYYRTTDDPNDWYGGNIHPLPAWMSSLSRVSAANGTAFLHTIGEHASVSFDHGVTFFECDSVLSIEDNVYWNGTYYYCRTLRSLNGINWTTIPNLSGTPTGTIALNSGMVVCSYEAGGDRFETSTNNGTSWTVHPYTDPITNMATDGIEVHFSADNTFGRFTDDNFLTYTPSNAAGLPLFFPFYGGGIWHRKGFNGRFMRSTDGGENYSVILFDQLLGSNNDPTVAYSVEQATWVICDRTAGSPVQWQLRTSSTGGATWDDSDILYGNGGSVAFIGESGDTGGLNPTPISLSGIVSRLHERIGHDASAYDVSELTDSVYGLVLAGEYTAADAIRTLMPVYAFDSAEYDSGTGYRIHYPKRGKPVVLTIGIDDLIDAPERTIREDALERPKVFHLHYENPDVGYAPAKATTRRNSQDVLVVGEQSAQVPVVFQDVDEPAQISDRLMRQIWVEVSGQEIMTIPDNLIGLVPSDCIGVSLRGQTRRMRIFTQEIGPGRIKLSLLPDRQSAYTSNVTGIPVPEPTPPMPSIVGETVYEYMDIPALNDNNDSLIWYDAASGQTSAWYGAQTQHKSVTDSEFVNSVTFNQNTIMGILLDPIPSASEHYTDTTNVVRVQLYTDDVIEALTQEQFLSEGGSFALKKASGDWEILQYRDVDDEGNGIFALSYLARGRLNSGASAHLSSSAFVLLDGVRSVPAITAWLGTDMTTRAVSFGTSPDTATQYVNPYVGKSQIEFPVANLLLDRAVDTITARAVPRHRFGTELNPVRSINWSGYRWTATDGANTATIPDSLTDSISFDATGWSSPITVTVAQLNRFTGAGPTVSEQIA